MSKFIAFVLFSIFFVACDSNTEAWRVVLEEPVGDIAKATL